MKINKPTIVTNAKKCITCGLVKPLLEFNKKQSRCKICQKEYVKEYRDENRDEILEKKKEFYDENKEEINKKAKEYYEANKEEIAKYQKEYYDKNKDKAKEYREENKDKAKEYRERPDVKQRRNEQSKIRRENDPNYLIRILLSGRVYRAIKDQGGKKHYRTMELVGCTIEELKQHLQATAIANGYVDFDINHFSGKEYHIDHIIPCIAFDLTLGEQQKLCFNWSNLQILTAEENLKKSDKWSI